MTLGFANNNPGNLRPGIAGVPWQGELAPDKLHNLCRFDTMENGVRALMRNLLAYQWKHDLNTIRGIISRWAPPNENDTAAYIKDVCLRTGLTADETIDLELPQVLLNLAAAIIHHENGADLPDAAPMMAAIGDVLPPVA
jgi:hypothetical protein